MDRRKIIPQDMPQTVTVCNIMYALGSMQWPQDMPQTVTVCNIMHALGSMRWPCERCLRNGFTMPGEQNASTAVRPPNTSSTRR